MELVAPVADESVPDQCVEGKQRLKEVEHMRRRLDDSGGEGRAAPSVTHQQHRGSLYTDAILDV